MTAVFEGEVTMAREGLESGAPPDSDGGDRVEVVPGFYLTYLNRSMWLTPVCEWAPLAHFIISLQPPSPDVSAPFMLYNGSCRLPVYRPPGQLWLPPVPAATP